MLSAGGICYDVASMTEVELPVPHGDVVALFEAAALGFGLAVERGTLRKYPGCTHWHLTTPGQKGTLEVTWWPARNRLWLGTHANRRAAWQDAALSALTANMAG